MIRYAQPAGPQFSSPFHLSSKGDGSTDRTFALPFPDTLSACHKQPSHTVHSVVGRVPIFRAQVLRHLGGVFDTRLVEPLLLRIEWGAHIANSDLHIANSGLHVANLGLHAANSASYEALDAQPRLVGWGPGW